MSTVPILHLSHVRELDAQHLTAGRAAIALGRKLLMDNPPPNTFAGGQTQRPFPKGA